MLLGMPRPPMPMGQPMPSPQGPAPMRPMPGPMKKPGARPPAAMIRQAILAKLQGAMK